MNPSERCNEDYWKSMFGKKYSEVIEKANYSCCKPPLLLEAYYRAHDIRKFEIDLYWRRSIYFWGFEISLAITPVISIIQKNSENLFFLSIFFVIIGFLLTVLWRMAMTGSKQWQENWEHHIDNLENEISGNLYKTICYREKYRNGFYSVSKINKAVNTLVMFFWLVIFFFLLSNACLRLDCLAKTKEMLCVLFGTTLFAIFLGTGLLHHFVRSDFSKDKITKVCIKQRGVKKDKVV